MTSTKMPIPMNYVLMSCHCIKDSFFLSPLIMLTSYTWWNSRCHHYEEICVPLKGFTMWTLINVSASFRGLHTPDHLPLGCFASSNNLPWCLYCMHVQRRYVESSMCPYIALKLLLTWNDAENWYHINWCIMII